MIKDTVEYKLIQQHYGARVAKRSQVPLMNHIDEGLVVLDRISATDDAKRAFCLHPLFQADADLKENSHLSQFIDSDVMMLAMEYRSVANEFLSDKMDDFDVGDSYYGIPTVANTIRLSPLVEVNEMLVADKVQNYKDFITYHRGTHARSKELSEYFLMWLAALDIPAETYNSLCKAIDASKA